jgi:hypothetical protein
MKTTLGASETTPTSSSTTLDPTVYRRSLPISYAAKLQQLDAGHVAKVAISAAAKERERLATDVINILWWSKVCSFRIR